MDGLTDAYINTAYQVGRIDALDGNTFDTTFEPVGADVASYAQGYLAYVNPLDPTLQGSMAHARSILGEDEPTNPVDVDYEQPCIQ